MPNLTITVTAEQAIRIKEAMGHRDPDTGAWVPATAAEITAEIKRLVRRQVQVYEKNKAEAAAAVAVAAELATEGWT